MRELIYRSAFILIVFFVSSINHLVWAQSDNQMLHDKYWFYRHRLTTEFLKMGLGSCGQPSGYSIPAASAYEGRSGAYYDLHFGDGTSFLGNYIGVLATEFRLLSDTYASTAQINRVKEELYYALKAYERLDLQAEVLWQPHKGKCTDYINGFFARDDVSSSNYIADFPTPYQPGTGTPKRLTSDYDGSSTVAGCTQAHYRFPTVDQISNLLVGFSLVIKCTSDGDSYAVPGSGEFYFKNAAKTYTDKILTYLTQNDYTIPVPYTQGCLAAYGSVESQLMAYPLAEAGNKLVNGKLGGDPVVTFLGTPPYNPYSRAGAYPATAGYWQSTLNYPAGVPLIQYFYNKKDYENAVYFQLAAVGNSWKVGLLSQRTTIAVLNMPSIVCEGSDCIVGDPWGGCWVSIPTGCYLDRHASVSVDVYCYNSNVSPELFAYVQNFVSGHATVPNWLDGLLPLTCSPFIPLPEFSINTTSTALSNYANTTNTWYFPLLHQYLHDCGPYSYDKEALHTALVTAPCTGPHYKPVGDIYNPPLPNSLGVIDWNTQSPDEGIVGWRVLNRWENSNAAQNTPPSGGAGWNGIDYMIAYNLYHIVHGGSDGFPAYQDELERELINKSYPIVTTNGTSTVITADVPSPLTEIGYETITSDHCIVNAGNLPVNTANVTFHAGKSIKITNLTLKPGAYFKAYIDPMFRCALPPRGSGTTTSYNDVISKAPSTTPAESSLTTLKKGLSSSMMSKQDSIQQAFIAQREKQAYVPLPTYLSKVTTQQNSDVFLFPNPAEDKLYIKKDLFESSQLDVQIIDLLGATKSSYSYNVREQTNEIVEMNIEDLESGIYFCKITCGSFSKTIQFNKLK